MIFENRLSNVKRRVVSIMDFSDIHQDECGYYEWLLWK